MKKIDLPFSKAIFFALILLLLISCSKAPPVSGTWEGTFMDKYPIEIEFRALEEGGVSGVLRLWDGDMQIQNDQLTKIKANRDQFTFYIPAKQTQFIGLLEGEKISGHFIFPDRSKHELLVRKRTTVSSRSAITEGDVAYPPEALVSDLEFTLDQLRNNHPALFAHQTEQVFEEHIVKAGNCMTTAKDIIAFYCVLAPLVNSVGCSHTGLRLPRTVKKDLIQAAGYFPAKVFFTADGVYFTKILDESLPIQAGDELLTINNHSISDIKEQVFSFIPAEGKRVSTKYFEINRQFTDYFVLLDNNSSFLVSYRREDGPVQVVVMESCSYDQTLAFEGKSSEELLSPFPVDFSIREKGQVGLLQISSFGIRDFDRYMAFVDSVFHCGLPHRLFMASLQNAQ